MPAQFLRGIKGRETNGSRAFACNYRRERLQIGCRSDLAVPFESAECNFNSFSRCRLQDVQVSAEKSVESVHKGGITWLELDSVEHRFLLAAAADASIAAYDVQACISINLRSHLRCDLFTS
jgi:hypothetical protein